jgi:predicted glycosyltransferase
MKIWIDFINSPQVSFFEPLINELTKAGHEFVLTCRDSANTVELIKQRGWSFKIIGHKAEKATIKKLASFPMRIKALYNYLKHKDINVAICQSSFYLPLTAKLLGVPAIYTNDNEHALGNIPAFLFATQILIPENLSLAKVIGKGAQKRKIVQYPGIKEGVYLWAKGQTIQNKRGEGHPKRKIFIRPEPLTAQYYTGKLNFLDSFLVELKEKYSVTILVRDKTQLEHYLQYKFNGIDVPERPLSFEEVAVNCSLFIGAGGSMTREMAIMGIPTISVYQGELLDVDNFLIKERLMTHEPELNLKDMEDRLGGDIDQQVNVKLIKKGKEAYELFKSELLKYNK